MDPYTVIKEHEYPRLYLFLKTSFQSQISDIRCILRLPYGHLKTGCNIASASLLFSLISGVSTCLYNASYEDFVREKPTGSGRKFKGVLRDYYPWKDEQLPIDEAIRIIYDSTRNPIEHSLGLYQPNEVRRSMIKKIRLTPKQIAYIESSEIKPAWLPPTITMSNSPFFNYDINVMSLYWGTFRLICRLLKDKKQLEKAEVFQMHLWDDYNLKALESTIKQMESMQGHSPDYQEKAEGIRHQLEYLNKRKDILTPQQQQAIERITDALGCL